MRSGARQQEKQRAIGTSSSVAELAEQRIQIKRMRSVSLHVYEILETGNLVSSDREQFCGCLGVVGGRPAAPEGHARTFGVIKITIAGL